MVTRTVRRLTLLAALTCLAAVTGLTGCASTPAKPGQSPGTSSATSSGASTATSSGASTATSSGASTATFPPVRPGASGPMALDDRPFSLHVPRTYVAGTAAPLVLSLHGYGGDSETFADRLSLVQASDSRGFLLAMPDGTKDPEGRRFWNATDACCDLYRSGVDDSAYLDRLVATVAGTYAVDPRKVFVIGLSNGGFMAHRLACDHADRFAAVVSLSGAQFARAASCRPSRAVSVLQVHGTADDTILFGGGAIGGNGYPSAEQTVATWRSLDHCRAQPSTTAPPLDAVAAIPGKETVRTSWPAGCSDGSEVALWTVRGGPHVPDYSLALTDALWAWLEAHARRS